MKIWAKTWISKFKFTVAKRLEIVPSIFCHNRDTVFEQFYLRRLRHNKSKKCSKKSVSIVTKNGRIDYQPAKSGPCWYKTFWLCWLLAGHWSIYRKVESLLPLIKTTKNRSKKSWRQTCGRFYGVTSKFVTSSPVYRQIFEQTYLLHPFLKCTDELYERVIRIIVQCFYFQLPKLY